MTWISVILLILSILVIILAIITPRLKDKHCKKCPKTYCEFCSRYSYNRDIFYIFSWLKNK